MKTVRFRYAKKLGAYVALVDGPAEGDYVPAEVAERLLAVAVALRDKLRAVAAFVEIDDFGLSDPDVIERADAAIAYAREAR